MLDTVLSITVLAAILLVVLGHVWRGLAFGGLVPEGLFEAVDMRLYAFHMPVFFAASGFFLARQVTGTSPVPVRQQSCAQPPRSGKIRASLI